MLSEQKLADVQTTDATCFSILKIIAGLGWRHPDIRFEEAECVCKHSRKNNKTERKSFIGRLWNEDFTISFVEADRGAVRVARIIIDKRKMLVFHSDRSHRGPSLYVLSDNVRFVGGMPEFPVEDEGACALYLFPPGKELAEAKIFPRPLFSSQKKIAGARDLSLTGILRYFDDWLKANVLAPLNERYWLLSKKSSEVMAVVGQYRLYESPEIYADVGYGPAMLEVQVEPATILNLIEEADKGLLSLEDLSAVQGGFFEEMQINMEEIRKAAEWYYEKLPGID